MFSLFSISLPFALSLAIAKGLFSFITRGIVAGILSFFGGVVSIIVMYVLKRLFGDKISLAITSISGAVSHNAAQLVAVSILWKSPFVFSLLPILIVSGVVFGAVNAILLKTVLPYLKKTGGAK
jgi:heptaprenyl diphosphate synthase